MSGPSSVSPQDLTCQACQARGRARPTRSARDSRRSPAGTGGISGGAGRLETQESPTGGGRQGGSPGGGPASGVVPAGLPYALDECVDNLRIRRRSRFRRRRRGRVNQMEVNRFLDVAAIRRPAIIPRSENLVTSLALIAYGVVHPLNAHDVTSADCVSTVHRY